MSSRNGATYLLALSLFSLAGAIIYFTWELAQVREEIPAILASVEQTSGEIEPVVKEIAAINEQIPPVLSEVTEIRKLVPPMLEEVRLTREQIPAILQESGKIREQVPSVLQESARIREQIPSILTEVEKSREMVPPTLDRVDQMIANARTVGQESGKGAVTGVITGILAAPFTIVGNIGKNVVGLSDEELKEFSEKDLELLKQAGQEALKSGKVDTSKAWKNPESGYSGKMTLIAIDKSDERECRVIRLQAWKDGSLKKDKEVTLCLNEHQQWEVKK